MGDTLQIEIPGLGLMERDEEFEDWLRSAPIAVPVLGGQQCRIVLTGYDDDASKQDFHDAIRNFLSIDGSVLRAAESHLYAYFEDNREYCEELPIQQPSDIWDHIFLGREPMVSRRSYGDKAVYISVECGCAWEEEHGLQIVFKNGLRVNKVGPYDGHLTKSDAYADPSLEDAVY